MSKIAIIGEENLTLGFESLGIDSFSKKKFEEVFLKNKDYSIIIISEKTYLSLSVKLKDKVDISINPIVVILGNDSSQQDRLKKRIIKTFGVDLLNKEKNK